MTRLPWQLWLSAGALALAGAYVLVPYDIIPDQIPYFGYLDDLIVVAFTSAFAFRNASEVRRDRDLLATKQALTAEVWALTDNRTGNDNQTLGVAERLGLPVKVLHVDYTLSIRTPNLLRGASLIGVERNPALKPPWPIVAIATGRRLAPISRTIRRRSGNRTKIVQIMDPESGRREFDLLVVPKHDRGVRGSNVMRVTGAPHRVTQDKLAAAARGWHFNEALYPTPRVAVLVGGDAKGIRFDASKAVQLGTLLCTLVRSRGSLLVTTSRRTHPRASDALRAALNVPLYFHRWSPAAKNPYLAFLAIADFIVVTGDSVSMCAEACATGKPVYIYAPKGLTTRKYRHYHNELYARNAARPLSATIRDGWQPAPFDPTTNVVSAVLKIIKSTRS